MARSSLGQQSMGTVHVGCQWNEDGNSTNDQTEWANTTFEVKFQTVSYNMKSAYMISFRYPLWQQSDDKNYSVGTELPNAKIKFKQIMNAQTVQVPR